MEKDLFGNPLKKRKTRLETQLSKYDRDTYNARLQRLKYVEDIGPKNYSMAGSFEAIYLFHEAGLAFINGAFVATIMLTQAFIERRLQDTMEARGLGKEARRGLAFILSYFRKNNLLDTFLLDKIDHLRKARNPFSHLKPFDHPYAISQRMFLQSQQPEEILEVDAKNALSLMYKLAMTNLE